MATADLEATIRHAASRLGEEFARVLSKETVERFVSDSREALESSAKVTTRLPILVERFARDRLRALTQARGLVPASKPSVLFLCVHNSGRSQMAAGWLRHLGGDAVDVFSGGSEPAGELNPTVVAAMAEVGVDITAEFPKPWTDEIVRAVDVVVTMGCGDACPVLPGKRYEDWELSDPAGHEIEVVRRVRDDIERRVRKLMVSLDLPVRA